MDSRTAIRALPSGYFPATILFRGHWTNGVTVATVDVARHEAIATYLAAWHRLLALGREAELFSAPAYADMPWFRFRRLSWEERLATAIEQRSIHNRLRRGRQEVARRLTNAVAALRGDWEADDY